MLVAAGQPAAADPIPLMALSQYLNGLKTAEAPFTQVNADGSISKGQIFIQRPGKVRFQYAPPDGNLVIANNGTVAVIDSKSNQPPQEYPLSRTPLNLILAANVDLTRANMVRGVREDGNKTIVTAQDPQHPDYGTIQLVFTANPTELRQWVITDQGGGQTTVILGAMKTGMSIASSKFDIRRASPTASNR
ncbi:LolA family protein [Acidimangrovimonas sediminis]|uniref:LolA family protein n=1 Tax=Acidimangrovimonas sediminis TaxID=2056283 RepID=UPI000C806CCC|nr:outer membrane lipoprotein carrier protein LolA [Acidimangrovimonas sediminis]